MRINPPDLNSKRARFADWLELIALNSHSGEASLSLLRSQIRRTTDGRARPTDFDTGGDDIGEPEITDRVPDDLEERVLEELELRAETIGSAYPFELISRGALGTSQVVRRKPTYNDMTSGEAIYVFCLLDSGIRDDLIEVPTAQRRFVTAIGSIFQICACLAVGGYTKAHVVSFGFPRATGDGFLPALKAAWERYGSYTIHETIPYGFDTKLKDGGVDIIAWRAFPDGHAATFLMFVQVASGLDWKNKPVASDVKTIRQWFVNERFDHFLPAICIPFPLWFDLEEPAKVVGGGAVAYRDGVRVRFAYREPAFGVIFDRGRIARSTALAFQDAELRTKIDGMDRVGEVTEWVGSVLSELAERRAAA